MTRGPTSAPGAGDVGETPEPLELWLHEVSAALPPPLAPVLSLSAALPPFPPVPLPAEMPAPNPA